MLTRFVSTATLLALSLSSAPASAKLTFIFAGTVTEQLTAGTDPLVSLGDRLTVTLKFDPADLPPHPDFDGFLMIGRSATAKVFSIRTSRGLQWLAKDEYLDMGVPVALEGKKLAWSGYFNRPNVGNLPDIAINAAGGSGSFTIQSSLGYGNTTQSLGFRGVISQVSPAPEPAAWAMIISGFALVGGAMRRRTRINLALA